MSKIIEVINGKLICGDCNQLLLTNCFYRTKTRKCGYSTYCKTCQNARARAWQKLHPEQCLANTQNWRAKNPQSKKERGIYPVDGKLSCIDCEQQLPVSAFCVNQNRKCGYNNICRSCNNTRMKAWRAKRRGYVAYYQKEWRAKNAEHLKQYDINRYWSDPEYHRSRISDTMATPEGRAKRVLWEQQRRSRAFGVVNDLTTAQWHVLLEYYNYCCLACGRDDVPLTRDHIVPLTKGGALTLSNVQPLCRPCNASKKQKVIDYRLRNPR
jgi:hypothetical protein